jgi:hypothetical protein
MFDKEPINEPIGVRRPPTMTTFLPETEKNLLESVNRDLVFIMSISYARLLCKIYL